MTSLYYDESPFQDGIVAKAVNSVTASGVLYFSSASNAGNKDDGTSGTWEGDFSDGWPTSSPLEAGRLHNFGGGVNANTCLGSGPGGSQLRADLFWSDPLGASTNDYDLYVLNSGGVVVASSLNTQNGTQDPYESCGDDYERRIHCHCEVFRGGKILAPFNRTWLVECQHARFNARDMTARQTLSTLPRRCKQFLSLMLFQAVQRIPSRHFSSDGLRRVFFQANGTPITPGNFSSTGGAVRQKPDITAATM